MSNLSKTLKEVPARIVSNQHGWWGDDYFRFYLSLSINNNTKYIDVQHNGTYFIFDNNAHFDISGCLETDLLAGENLVLIILIVRNCQLCTQFNQT